LSLTPVALQIFLSFKKGYIANNTVIKITCHHAANNPEVSKVWGAPPGRGAVGPLGVGGSPVVCMRDVFISNEIWAQGKIYILVVTVLG
jgi:hypothetical protein